MGFFDDIHRTLDRVAALQEQSAKDSTLSGRRATKKKWPYGKPKSIQWEERSEKECPHKYTQLR